MFILSHKNVVKPGQYHNADIDQTGGQSSSPEEPKAPQPQETPAKKSPGFITRWIARAMLTIMSFWMLIVSSVLLVVAAAFFFLGTRPVERKANHHREVEISAFGDYKTEAPMSSRVSVWWSDLRGRTIKTKRVDCLTGTELPNSRTLYQVDRENGLTSIRGVYKEGSDGRLYPVRPGSSK